MHNIEMTTTAFGDESMRVSGAPPFYMLGVAIVSEEDDFALAELEGILPNNARKLHWREMSRKRQSASLAVLNKIQCTNLVVVASPLTGNKQERARRKCLETILPVLESRKVDRLILESRDTAANKFDLSYVDYAKNAKYIDTIKVYHEDAGTEHRLWIADQILGALGDYRTQTGEWRYWEAEWLALSKTIEIINIAV